MLMGLAFHRCITEPFLLLISSWLTFSQVAYSQTADAFNPGANHNVGPIAVQPDGKIVVGGDFDTLGGRARSFICRLNPDGSVDTNFNSSAGTSVYCLAVQSDGKILVGGNLPPWRGRQKNILAGSMLMAVWIPTLIWWLISRWSHLPFKPMEKSWGAGFSQ